MEQSERLRELVAVMTFQNSYWGYLFARIRRVEDSNLPSIMGVSPNSDGTISLRFHPELVRDTDDENLKWILEHEGMHVLNKHIPRLLTILANEVDQKREMAKMAVWNIAADCAVNVAIAIPKILKIGGRPWTGQHPDLYGLPDDRSTEYYFSKLMSEYDSMESEGGEGSGEDLFGMADDVDDHGSWGNVTKQVTDVGSLARKIDGYTKKIIKESLKAAGRNRGTIPGHIMELIESALEPPKVPYYQLIRRLIRGSKMSKFKRAFTKVNRKRTYVFTIGELNIPQISPFPGRTRDFTFNICVLIDTSGSMSPDDIKEGLSGVKNIIENDRHCKLTVLENDTHLQKEYECKKIRDIDFEVKGRGGTILEPGLRRARELRPDVTLCFTDGYCDDINTLPRKILPRKLIWAIQQNGTAEHVNKTGYIVRIEK